MTERATVIRRIQERLGDRPLVWFGTRGDDAEGVADIENLHASFSIIGRYSKRATVAGYALEDYSGIRVDLDAHDIDEDPYVAPIRELRADLLNALSVPSVVFTYRPSAFLSAVCFSRLGRAEYLGMFKDHQFAFEHKPWVETEVAKMGLPQVPWRYIADIEQDLVLPMFRRGPVVLRRSRSSGGTGVQRLDHAEQLAALWPQEDEAYVSVAPFVGDAVPVNVGAVVWNTGVTVDLPSVQLIGTPGATSRPFGYCGNDFAAVRDLPLSTIAAIELATTRIGEWMRGLGYRGTFGVDFLVQDGVPLFMEINPRFQGSSHASSHLARSQGESCLMTDHLSALMDHEPGPRRPLTERVHEAPALSHIVVHELDDGIDSARIIGALADCADFRHADVVHPGHLKIESSATLARMTFSRSITQSGFDLAGDISAALGAARRTTEETTVPR